MSLITISIVNEKYIKTTHKRIMILLINHGQKLKWIFKRVLIFSNGCMKSITYFANFYVGSQFEVLVVYNLEDYQLILYELLVNHINLQGLVHQGWVLF